MELNLTLSLTLNLTPTLNLFFSLSVLLNYFNNMRFTNFTE